MSGAVPVDLTNCDREPRGEVQVAYPADGVKARFVLPAAHVNEQAAPESEAHPVLRGRTTTLDGLTVLVVEDQLMIAMDIEQVLRRLGAQDVLLAPQVDEALALLAQSMPDVAVLDFNLGTQNCVLIADALQGRGVPFVFATGYGDGVMFPERFRHVPIVSKPVDAAALADKIAQARDVGP
jgi:CheY-like chemotaxis protein